MSLIQIRTWMNSPYFSRIRIRELRENRMITIFDRKKTNKSLEALVDRWKELCKTKNAWVSLELSFKREAYPYGGNLFHEPEWMQASYSYPINSVIAYLKEVGAGGK